MPYSSEEESISANTSPHMLKPSASNTTTQDKVLATESSPDKVTVSPLHYFFFEKKN